MRKRLLQFSVLLLTFVCLLHSKADVNAATKVEADVEWDTSKTLTVRKGGYTFCGYLSTDKKKCWLNEIRIHPKRGNISTLRIPDKMKGAVVIRLGYDQGRGDDEIEFSQSIFGEYEEIAHGCDAYMKELKNVNQLILPAGLEQIDYVCFSGMRRITKLTIPSKVRS